MESQRFKFVLTAFALLIICTAVTSRPDSNPEPEPEPTAEVSCKAAVGLLMKRVLNDIGQCSNSMTFKSNKERTQKFHCILKCVSIGIKILTPEGHLEKATVDAFIQKEVAPNLVQKVTPLIYTCFDNFVGKVDPAEEFCKSYKPFIKCFMDAIPTFCVEPKE